MKTKESKDFLGDRMKSYEAGALALNGNNDKYTVIRLDGNAFHTWVKKAKLAKGFDYRMITAMQDTTLGLCNTITTAIMGYCQSDEITIVLKKGENENSEAWFNNRVQKLCSISASMAAYFFNKRMYDFFLADESEDSFPPAFFDARVMFFPTLEEVINCLIWRQNDCIKNSVASLAQMYFSPKELNRKNQDAMKHMLEEKGISWDKMSHERKYGTFIHKQKTKHMYKGTEYERSEFFIDTWAPIFSKDKQFLIDAYNFKIEKSEK